MTPYPCWIGEKCSQTIPLYRWWQHSPTQNQLTLFVMDNRTTCAKFLPMTLEQPAPNFYQWHQLTILFFIYFLLHRFQYGSDVFNHLFDGSAVLQKFTIAAGEVQYLCKFVKTKVRYCIAENICQFKQLFVQSFFLAAPCDLQLSIYV